MSTVTGIHHITAISGDPQETLEFYQGVLGMRLVKRSINQDAPDTYHLFFADAEGHPGTDITFFPWPHLGAGRHGAGNWGEVALSIPPDSLQYWQNRMERFQVDADQPETRFGEKVLPFRDPHGMRLSLVESPLYQGFAFTPWEKGPVPAEYQIHGLGGVQLVTRDITSFENFFGTALGFQPSAKEGRIQRYSVGEAAAGQRIDVRLDASSPRGNWGIGSVHHVAWRAPDTEALDVFRQAIRVAGGNPTDDIDRFWFVSLYVREPGGALCEIATDGPGFGVDESMDDLGTSLVLPSWYEAQRQKIENGLPPLRDVDPGEYR
ncbi:MAG: VOC family protein [Spirochaeta sp.]